MVAVGRRLEAAEESGLVPNSLYRVDDIVRMPDFGVIAIVTAVNRGIGTLPRYNVVDEDGDPHINVPETDLYPDILQKR